MPDSAMVALGLVTVNIKLVDAPIRIGDAPNAIASVGGLTTVNVALPVDPTPVSVADTVAESVFTPAVVP